MSNVESQIAMSLQGLMAGQRQANVNVSGAGGGGMDPRVLQQMLQMQEAEAMGLTKEQEKMQKEQMRQENRATLGVMLQDTLARQQQEEAFQRQVDLQNQMFERERELQLNIEKMERERLIMVNEANNAGAERMAAQIKKAEAEQLGITRKALLDKAKLDGLQNFLGAAHGQALPLIARKHREVQLLHNRVDAGIETLNVGILGGKSEGRDVVTDTREYAKGLSRLMLQAENSSFSMTDPDSLDKVRAVERAVEDLLLASQPDYGKRIARLNPQDRDVDPQELQLRDFGAALQRIEELTGNKGKVVAQRALNRMADKINTVMVEEPKKPGVLRTNDFAKSSMGTLFQSANNMIGSGLWKSPTDIGDPDELFHQTMMAGMAALYEPDPATGELLPVEQRIAEAESLVSSFVDNLATEFKFTQEESEQLRGYSSAFIRTIMPYDDAMLAFNMSQAEAQGGQMTQAQLDELDNATAMRDRFNQYLKSVTSGAMKREMGDEATGIGEAAPGSKPTGASDAAQPAVRGAGPE